MLRYDFNDSYVRETAAQDSISPKAYVLFYKRRKGALRWSGMIPPATTGLEDEVES